MKMAKRHLLPEMVSASAIVIANVGSLGKNASSVTDKASELVCNDSFCGRSSDLQSKDVTFI